MEKMRKWPSIKKITWEEYQRIKEIKFLDLEICDYRHTNILNLGWEPWGKWYCAKHEREHILCKELCLPISRNVFRCELVRKRTQRTEELIIAVNQKHYKSSCYLCQKELKGAGKHGVIKNRNNPAFWGIASSYKIMCLVCIGKEFYGRMVDWQRKKWRKYVKRGYE